MHTCGVTHTHTHKMKCSWGKGQGPKGPPRHRHTRTQLGSGKRQAGIMTKAPHSGAFFGFSLQKRNLKIYNKIMPNSLKVIKNSASSCLPETQTERCPPKQNKQSRKMEAPSEISPPKYRSQSEAPEGWDSLGSPYGQHGSLKSWAGWGMRVSKKELLHRRAGFQG